jgi:hypothetical protein
MTTRRLIMVAAVACTLTAVVIIVTQVGFGASSGSNSTAGPSPSASGQQGRHPGSAQQPPSSGRDNGGNASAARGDGGKHRGNPFAVRYPAIEPAKMTPPMGGFAPATIMWPDNGGWHVGSHTLTTDIEAGGDAQHRADGLFQIIREYPLRSTSPQTNDLVRVAGSGPITITKAPLGSKVVVSAQKHGNIEFKSKRGITGTLHLDDDTVTLNP